jgi:cyclase
MAGYDLPLIRKVSASLQIPLIVCGGAGTKEHLIEAFQAGASAVAAGSMFVFHGKHRAVLISYHCGEKIEHKPL